VYNALNTRCKSHDLLPNIQALSWEEISPDCFQYAQLFATRPLLKFKLSITKNVINEAISFLDNLPHMSPFIQEWDLVDDFGAAEVFQVVSADVSKTISSLTRLRKLNCCHHLVLSDDAIRHIASSTTLQELHICTDASVLLRALCKTPLKSSFRFVQHLRFASHLLRDVIELMPFLALDDLHSLHVTYGLLPTAAALQSLFESLSNYASHTVLEALELSDECADHKIHTPVQLQDVPPSPEEVAITGTTLKPLYVFKNLTSLKLEFHFEFDIDDGTMKDMASAWPNLQTLQLCTYTGWKTRSRISLDGLHWLVSHCKDLDVLALVISASRPDSSCQPIGGPYTPNERITHLNLGNSTLEDVSNVASFLHQLLPNLQFIENKFDPQSNPTGTTCWWQVIHHIDSLRLSEKRGEEFC
jgi:hypothetical protein